MSVETEATTELIELHLSYHHAGNVVIEPATHTPALHCTDDPCPSNPWDYDNAVFVEPKRKETS